MALTRKNKSVVELNHVSAVRTGNIKAQYPLNTGITEVEQGMLLVVDETNKKVKMPAAATDYVYLHASEEQIYESHLGRNSFSLKAPKLPRMYKLEVGDIFETNAINDAAQAIAKDVLAYPATTGYITTAAAANASAVVELKVVEVVTLPNGETGAKFVVTKA